MTTAHGASPATRDPITAGAADLGELTLPRAPIGYAITCGR